MRIVPVPRDGEDILLPFLVLCCNWSMDRPPLDAEAVRADDHLNRYIEGWGRTGDLGVMAVSEDGGPEQSDSEASDGEAGDGDADPSALGPEADPRVLGAAWLRTMEEKPGYGWVADDIPELSIAVLPAAQGEGLGRRLMQALLQMARLTGVTAVSLAVEETNGARHLYDELGFTVVGRTEGSDIMVLDLAPQGG